MSEASSPEKVEMVRKVYARDVKAKERLLTVFRVAQKQKHATRAGKNILMVTLVDRTGTLDARVFDKVEIFEPTFAVNDYILVEGNVQTFQGHPQLAIERLERLDPGPIDAKEFAFEEARETPEGSGKSKAVAQIRELVHRVHDDHVRQLLLLFLDDANIAASLPYAPAAKGIHHAYRGGLADHILSVMKLAHRVADQYPMADRDLLLAGAMLHDIGKVGEISFEKGKPFEYTDEGRLVGHLVMTAQMIREKSRQIPHFPPLLEQHLTHLVVAHHGELAYGSPKVPVTLEAMLVHMIDMMDSKVASWLEHMERDPHDKWTDTARFIDRHLWKAPTPTSRQKGPVEGAGGRPKPSREHRRKPSPRRAPVVEETPRAEAQTPPPPARDARLPEALAFKPFSLLTGETDGPTS